MALTKTSSSGHAITADGQRSAVRLSAHAALNLINICLPQARPVPGLSILPWPSARIDITHDSISSPSRLLSNLFWQRLNWAAIERELQTINVCDLGCGRGGYARRWQAASGNRIDRYVGIDTATDSTWPNTIRQLPFVNFRVADLNTKENPIPEGTTMITSQSVLEHVENDVSLLQRIARWVKTQDHPVLQIHLFPSRAGYYVYPFHGVRQYTPRTVAKLWQPFTPFSHAILYGLGNPRLSRLHFRYITLPSLLGRDRRRSPNSAYARALGQLLRTSEPSARAPSFYALCILSHGRAALPDLATSSAN